LGLERGMRPEYSTTGARKQEASRLPKFVLQPFSRGVDLHSWTRRRAVPGG
jgi:hypothetical protein